MPDQNILPPALVEADRSLTLTNPEMLHLVDKTYKIIKQARFVTAPPTWRDYLWMDFKKPEIPDNTLLPRDVDERDVWSEYIVIGWKNGMKQAENIYQTNLATLQRDFKGMVLYRTLLAKQMVTKPIAAGANMGITSNDDKTEMSINDRVLRISATPRFNTNSQQWNPVLINHGD
jgi:defect-in-organelle-trafficking protein DotC